MDNFITNNFTDKTIYNGEYVVFPLKETNVEYVLESTLYRIDTNKLVSNSINHFATGNKIEGVFSGKSVVYKLDLKNDHDLKTAEEFPTNGDTVLIVSVEPGYYAKLTLDVVDESPVERDDKTMAEIRHETAINLIMNGTEIATWYQSFKNGEFCEECHHTGLEKVIAIEDDNSYILSLEDHHHYAIYAEIYNDNNELYKYYREIFTSENAVTDYTQIPYVAYCAAQYDVHITPEGIDIKFGGVGTENESLKIVRPYKTTAMIRLVDLGFYDYNDYDLLRWQAGYELGDKLQYDPDRKCIHRIEMNNHVHAFNGVVAFDVSGYRDLVVIESINKDGMRVSSAVVNPDNVLIDQQCFAGCSVHDIKDDNGVMKRGKYLFMNMVISEFNHNYDYEIQIHGIPDKTIEEKPDEPSQTSKDLDYLCKLFEKNKKNLDPESEKRANKVIGILNAYAEPNSSMSKKEALVSSLMAWLYGDVLEE